MRKYFIIILEILRYSISLCIVLGFTYTSFIYF